MLHNHHIHLLQHDNHQVSAWYPLIFMSVNTTCISERTNKAHNLIANSKRTEKYDCSEWSTLWYTNRIVMGMRCVPHSDCTCQRLVSYQLVAQGFLDNPGVHRNSLRTSCTWRSCHSQGCMKLVKKCSYANLTPTSCTIKEQKATSVRELSRASIWDQLHGRNSIYFRFQCLNDSENGCCL